jgi:hypothetical protein
MSADRLALARHLDRGLVGLCARIPEERQIREGRVDQPPSEPLAFGHLEQVRGVPEFAALFDQRLHQVGMRMPDGIDCDAGAEIEIAVACRRGQPATVATLERDVGPSISRNDRRRHIFGRHGSPP